MSLKQSGIPIVVLNDELGDMIIGRCCSQEQAARLAQAPNVEAIKARKTKQIVRIVVTGRTLTRKDWDARSLFNDSNISTWEEQLFTANPDEALGESGKPIAGFRTLIQHKSKMLLEEWPAVLRREMDPLYTSRRCTDAVNASA